MKFIEKIILLLKKIISKEQKIKMIEAKEEPIIKKENFKEKLQVETIEKKKQTVETLTCFGDGLGIQTEMKA